MCLAVVALGAHPRYTLVLAANRDEFYARAAAPVAWSHEEGRRDILAGRDLLAGGTWLGIAPSGRWAFVTNVREPGRYDVDAPSRGALVPQVLHDPRPVIPAVTAIAADGAVYNGFNLIAGDAATAAWCSNRTENIVPLAPGVHGISNARLDTPWPKVKRVREGVIAWIERGEEAIDPLFDILADRRMAPDAELPSTGVSLEWERALSAPFIATERYGTRCSSIITLDRDGEARFRERSFDERGELRGDIDERFRVERS